MCAVECHCFVDRPRKRLHDAALDLVADAVRIDRLAAVDDRGDARDLDPAAVALDHHLQRHRAIGREILVTGKGEARAAAGAAGTPLAPAETVGRALCELLHPSCCQPAMLPSLLGVACSWTVMAEPMGSQPCSCSRIHCRRTGWLGTARAASAASAATSSAPLWP